VTSRDPVEVVVALYEALRDSRTKEMLALVDPAVICRPLVRPGITQYFGYSGMILLDRDMHAAHGRYQIEIGTITVQDGPQVTVEAVIVPGPGCTHPPVSVTSVYTLRGGLITWIESLDDTGTR
jgi:hypothetical protein